MHNIKEKVEWRGRREVPTRDETGMDTLVVIG